MKLGVVLISTNFFGIRTAELINKSREVDSDAEIDSIVEKKRIPDVSSVEMFKKLTELRMSLWNLSINSNNILIGDSHCSIRIM